MAISFIHHSIDSIESMENIEFLIQRLIPLVNQFRKLQDVRGCVVREVKHAQNVLEKILICSNKIYNFLGLNLTANAFKKDINNWQTRGLESLPDFCNSQAAYIAPEDGSLTFFIGAFVSPNGPIPKGNFLECFLAKRNESEECKKIYQTFVHPKNFCQSCHLLFASEGLSIGNCIVFFPENIASIKKLESQDFALFFFNKFEQIYMTETIPKVEFMTGNKNWRSTKLSTSEFYHARCLWGYLHDYYHHCGPRPLDRNLQIKMNWFTGLLEEIKVDCLTAITAYGENIPFGYEIVEFIIFERLFRYPNQSDATKNFDSGTGVFLFEWLYKKGAISSNFYGKIQIDIENCITSMQILVTQIECIEKNSNDKEYLYLAKDFVRRLLPEGNSKEIFSFPKTFLKNFTKLED